MRFLRLLPLLLLTGCVPFNTTGSRHYLVLGFGLISVNSTNQSVADITRSHVLGVCGTLGPLPGVSAGYISTATISVKTNSNVLIDVSKGKVQIP